MAFTFLPKRRLCQESLLRLKPSYSLILVSPIILSPVIPSNLSLHFVGNPTGTVFRKEEVELLVKIAKERNIFLMADEPYREYAFDNPSVSLLAYMQVRNP